MVTAEHGPLAEDARRRGARIAERTIERHGLWIADEDVKETASEITSEVLDAVRVMWRSGLPAKLAMKWGDECMNGVQERLLEHMGYLKVAAAFVRFDPSPAITYDKGEMES
jgi:hypothetical protein